MKAICALALVSATAALCAGQEQVAPTNELAFELGGIPSNSEINAPQLAVNAGVVLGINHDRRVLAGPKSN